MVNGVIDLILAGRTDLPINEQTMNDSCSHFMSPF